MLPNFVIIGAQKSASTYAHLALRKHPDVHMPADETPFFEDPHFTAGDPRPLTKLFAHTNAPLRGIKRPNYLAEPEVPSRIRSMLPEARLIARLREPISRFLSAYHYYMKIGVFPVLPVAQALPRLLAGEALGSPYAHELLEYGRYATHLRRYLRIFPEEQILVLLQDDFTANPRQTLNAMTEFLGARQFDSLPKISRDNAGLYSLPRLRFLRSRNRFLFHYDPAKPEFREKSGVVKYLGAGAITAIDRIILAHFHPNDKPRLAAPLMTQLQDFYGPEIDALEAMLGRSLQAWRATRGI